LPPYVVEYATIVRTYHMNKRSQSAKNRSRTMAAASSSIHDVFGVEEVRAGLPISELNDFAKELRVERSKLADVLGTTLRTLQRITESDRRLGPAASDRLARMRRIHQLATHVFGERSKASLWLTSPSRGLNGEVPLYLLDTDIGTQRVQHELRQIEFGMPF
jgi:putative toxin-antitoxin system antitoxin component (TIGR02293 family)